MPADSHTMEVRSGEEVTIRPIKPVGEDVVRVDIEADGVWRLDITREGEIADVVTTRDADGTLADRDLPEWIDEVTAKFAQF
ncbi:hypothetical protein [Haloarcula argentinensis]|uniref:Uncharacterized protein n=2 Tax=Haloarcula argentinensis TaxID=43776 RepID=A0A830FAC0_HALAR|nr:hypothetical protein [Haloarcula argentinensis]EMA23436.1 hypothetical protein C443_07228 [Haloarcula argentinensis DSM 12282]GGM28133.1 hypothetical protein GCM10009006_07110 [Haloarcula argentinensis]